MNGIKLELVWGILAVLILAFSAISCGIGREMPANAGSQSKADYSEEAVASIKKYFIQRYTTDEGVHLESVLSGIGASAGFGCQMAIREGFVKTGQVPESKAFVEVNTKSGNKFYFGDFLNQPLLEAQVSVWSIVGGGAEKAGATNLPDVLDIVKYNAETLDTEKFGVPRLPQAHMPREMPADALRETWSDVLVIMKAHQVAPEFYGWIPATAAQQVIIEHKDNIDPALAAKIVMESALPMSKVDPETSINP